MISMLLGMVGGWELAMLGGPLISKFFIKENEVDVLLNGPNKPTQIRFLDDLLQDKVGELTWLQRKSHEKVIIAIRRVTNTRAFELILAKLIKDKWVFNTGFIKQ